MVSPLLSLAGASAIRSPLPSHKALGLDSLPVANLFLICRSLGSLPHSLLASVFYIYSWVLDDIGVFDDDGWGLHF